MGDNKSRISAIYKIVLLCFIVSICTNINNKIANQNNFHNTTTLSEFILIPELTFEPKFYDFGYIKEGYVYQTTFEIWNKGTDVLVWSLRTRNPWISVFPKSGSSTGEHDIINVTINTTGLSLGNYESNVYIHASGDYIFYNYFIISDKILAYYPISKDFGYVKKGEILQTTFEIWNNGTGNLEWNIESYQPWMSISPLSGSSTGENDIVTVIINTSDLLLGLQSGEINLYSNGGEGNFTISLNVDHPPDKPVINGPSSGKKNTEYTYTFFSTDPDGDDVGYCIDWGDDTAETYLGPYSSGEKATAKHSWNVSGIYTIKIKAINVYGIESDWAMYNISMPKNNAIISLLQMFVNNNQFLFKLLNYL